MVKRITWSLNIRFPIPERIPVSAERNFSIAKFLYRPIMLSMVLSFIICFTFPFSNIPHSKIPRNVRRQKKINCRMYIMGNECYMNTDFIFRSSGQENFIEKDRFIKNRSNRSIYSSLTQFGYSVLLNITFKCACF